VRTLHERQSTARTTEQEQEQEQTEQSQPNQRPTSRPAEPEHEQHRQYQAGRGEGAHRLAHDQANRLPLRATRPGRAPAAPGCDPTPQGAGPRHPAGDPAPVPTGQGGSDPPRLRPALRVRIASRAMPGLRHPAARLAAVPTISLRTREGSSTAEPVKPSSATRRQASPGDTRSNL
jgi:hypothetical protein